MLMSWRDPENTGGESWGEKVPSSGLTDDRRAAMLTVSCTAAAKKKTKYDVQQAAAAGLPLTLFRRRPLSNPQSCPPFGRATPSHGAPMAEPPPSRRWVAPRCHCSGWAMGFWGWAVVLVAVRASSAPLPHHSQPQQRTQPRRQCQCLSTASSFTEAVPFILLCPPPDPAHLHPSRPPRSAHNQTFVPPSPSWDYTLSNNTPVPSLVGDSILYPPRPSPLASPPT